MTYDRFGRRGLPKQPDAGAYGPPTLEEWVEDEEPKVRIERLTSLLRDQVQSLMDPAKILDMTEPDLRHHIEDLVAQASLSRHLLLNKTDQQAIAEEFVNDIIALGPLGVLMRDAEVADILVNGPNQVYVERHGKLELTDTHFRSDAQLLSVVQRIGASIGRRVDEQTPMLDAQLKDGSRVNVIIRPLSIKGVCLSIRRFSKIFIDFARLVTLGGASAPLARAMEIAARCRLNIVISGGTGSGKTTLLNALSQAIEPNERIVTIEDVAELQLHQPQVVPLEARPPSVEGTGQVTQRDLLRNALRMRPDRIIVGEVRGPEAFDMLQAMNTGHAGSMTTVHANSARDAMARIENMVLMANTGLPARAILGQIASAVDLVIQIERMRDGTRRITEFCECAGIEGEEIRLVELFQYRFTDENPDGTMNGVFEPTGSRPRFLKRLGYYGLDQEFMRAITPK